MTDTAWTAYAATLGVLAACITLAIVATLAVATWRAVRYTRPGWWLHRHLPTRRGH